MRILLAVETERVGRHLDADVSADNGVAGEGDRRGVVALRAIHAHRGIDVGHVVAADGDVLVAVEREDADRSSGATRNVVAAGH